MLLCRIMLMVKSMGIRLEIKLGFWVLEVGVIISYLRNLVEMCEI